MGTIHAKGALEDETAPRRVVVTGLGIVGPLGCDVEESWRRVLAGESGVGPITSFDASRLSVRIAAEVKDFDPSRSMDKRAARRMDPYARYAVAAARAAEVDAGIDVDAEAERVGALIGSGVGGLLTFQEQFRVLFQKGPDRLSPLFIPMMIPNMAAAQVSLELGTRGPCSTVGTA